MCEVDALDGKFPVIVIDSFKSFGLHDFTVLFQQFISDKVRCFLFYLQLVKFLLTQMVQPK